MRIAYENKHENIIGYKSNEISSMNVVPKQNRFQLKWNWFHSFTDLVIKHIKFQAMLSRTMQGLHQ